MQSVIAFNGGITFVAQKTFVMKLHSLVFFQIFLEFYSFQLCAEPEKRTHDSSDTIFMHYFFHVIFFVRHPYYRVVFNQPLQRNRILLKYDIIMYIIMRVRILLRIQKIYS